MRSLPLVAIRRRAAVALLLLTALTGGSYALQRVGALHQQRSDKILDVAARQEMLSQRIALLVQALGSELTPGQRTAARQRLNRATTLLATSHRALLDGSDGIPAVEAPPARRELHALDGPLNDFLNHARGVSSRTLLPGDADVRYVRAAAQTA